MVLRDVKIYLKQVQEEIEKFKEEYQVHSDILDFTYIDLDDVDYVYLILVSVGDDQTA